MTSIDTCCTPHGAREPPATSERIKSILICPACGFESVAAEKWIVRAVDDGERFVCPDCATTVATR